MKTLRFPAPIYSQLAESLLADRSRESCAIVYTRPGINDSSWLVADARIAPDDAYERRTATSATLKSAFVVELSNAARKDRLGIVMVHTHPFADGTPEFSSVDDLGEKELALYFARRVSHAAHLSMVIGPHGCRARRLASDEEVFVWQIGQVARVISSGQDRPGLHDIYDRQLLAFGESGQRALKSLRVGVVGAGGTGSVTAQQLAHLGVKDFLIVDPDVVQTTNLNRLVGSTPADVGQPKVLVARRTIRAINTSAQVVALQRDVVDEDAAMMFADMDFIFICTDSHASRAVVGQLAYQYLIPTIDMGVSITARDASVSHLTGRVQMLAPELPCLVCTEALDSEQIRREMLTPEQRAADSYIHGGQEAQPAVISLNSTVSSLAVTMFLAVITSVPARARFQLYDGIRGTVRPTTATRVPSCVVCSNEGALARGSTWPLPVRPTGAPRG
jgi:molybdopterin-synthase adenylyltransferase